MGLSWSHILIVLVLFLLLFGRGKISDLMGDFAKGIKSFKQGLADEPEAGETEIMRAAPTAAIEHKKPVPSSRSRKPATAKSKTTRGRKSG